MGKEIFKDDENEEIISSLNINDSVEEEEEEKREGRRYEDYTDDENKIYKFFAVVFRLYNAFSPELIFSDSSSCTDEERLRFMEELAGLKSVTVGVYDSEDKLESFAHTLDTDGLTYGEIYNMIRSIKERDELVSSVNKIEIIDDNLSVFPNISEWNLDEYSEEEKRIGKFHAIMSTIYEGYSDDYATKHEVFEYYEHKIDEFKDEDAGLKSVTVTLISKNDDTEELKIDTEGLTYDQIYNKLEFYRLLDDFDDIVIDNENNLVVKHF
mgnify:CR=1 FL=1